MSTPRLTFLYPLFYRSIRSSETAAVRSAPERKSRAPQRACFHAAPSRRQVLEPQQRYGTANEPPPHLGAGKPIAPRDATVSKPPDSKASQPQPLPPKSNPDKTAPPPADKTPQDDPTAPPSKTTSPAQSALLDSKTDTKNVLRDAKAASPSQPKPELPQTAGPNPLETVLAMPSPSERKEQPPHLKTPPYVHHFDTFGLVRELEQAEGFSRRASVTLMKAVRGILAENMELARESLVSKSNIENETYLFRAACSELKTETQTKRHAAAEKMRSERTQLQHEVDMLNQRFGQEMANMKEELKGMFDDRKMAVRMEQRDVDSKIQQLNYKITVTLNSDARSEVEGLRWVLTRRAAIAIALSALMILSTLRYTSYMMQMQEDERKKMAEKDKPVEAASSGNGSGPSRPPGVGEEVIGEELLASQGGGQGYVSLG